MKVTIEFELPEGQEIPRVEDILTLTSPDWYTERWHIDDVKMGRNITDDQARDVLELMYKHHDCNIGTNWEFIEAMIDIVVPDWTFEGEEA
jgi:hypothetical protein